MLSTSFTDLPISQEILRAISEMGFEEATPIQTESIPHLMEGRDILGQAQTGTGKTAAFGIPIIEHAETEARHIQYLILSPTRELAIQIADELHDICKYKEGVRILAVYGGQPIDRQILALKKKPQIIVGTPGRVMDHMRRKTMRLDQLQGIILDEADEMLNMGFKEDIDTILASTPAEIQKVFFSATLPRSIVELTDKYLREPLHVRIAQTQLTVTNTEQFYIEVRETNKIEVLSRLIEAERIKRALVFCNTKKMVDEHSDKLQTRSYAAEALHGAMK
ncbi:MAG: DEAD/DEAH box helicase, partial [Clostridiaceae bacterium]|nr:DEAD/DEAH box helicase [Clostridiaceae bacterium]